LVTDLTPEELTRFATAIREKNNRDYHVLTEVQREGGHIWIRTATGPNFPAAEHIFWCPQCGEHAYHKGLWSGNFHLDRKPPCILNGVPA